MCERGSSALDGEAVGPQRRAPRLGAQPCHVAHGAADLVCARLKELKGHNFSEATLFSLGHVTELKLNKWVHKAAPKREKKVVKPKVEPEEPQPQPEPAAEQEQPKAETREDKVLLIGQLFVQKRVASKVVQELFRQLLGAAKVELACGLLRTVGPTLDGSEAGAAIVESVLARLEELQRAHPEVGSAVGDVARLRAQAWSPALRTYSFAVKC